MKATGRLAARANATVKGREEGDEPLADRADGVDHDGDGGGGVIADLGEGDR